MGEHWDHLRCALDKLRWAKLFGRLHKCEFLKDRVDYLGFEVSKEGIRTSPEKVKAFWIGLDRCLRMMCAHVWDLLHITENALGDSHKLQSP